MVNSISEFLTQLGDSVGVKWAEPTRQVVCVQGLGFVGAAMAVAVANARDESGKPYFNVIGVELPNASGLKKVQSINSGKLCIESLDHKLHDHFKRAIDEKNLMATTNPEVYSVASVVLVDIHLDITFDNNGPTVDFSAFRQGIRTIAEKMQPKTLIIVETTVPPGTCEKIVAPEIQNVFRDRGLPENAFLLAHSYERVMPGKEYYDSIVNYWRVYSGYTKEAADVCEAFLSKVINVRDYPLTRLKSTTASETAKVLENSYRATNIAFIEEWGRFAEAVGIDLFEVINAIRVRPTHNNIRQPGFGVGGYCLTKDPLFASVAAEQLFGLGDLQFPYSMQSVKTNDSMPLVTLDKIQGLLGGSLQNKMILLCGITYRPDVADTRYSPSQTFVEQARKKGANVIWHDPLISYWAELDLDSSKELPSPKGMDAVVFAVNHEEYTHLDFEKWLDSAKPLIFDANNVLSLNQRECLQRLGVGFSSIGRG